MATPAQEAFLDGLSVLAGILYIIVGVLQARRPVTKESRGALIGFVIWWVGIGIISMLSLAFRFWPPTDLGLTGYLVFIYTLVAALFAILAGLLYYLLFVYTGRRWTKWFSIAFYALLMVGVVALFQYQEPSGIGPDPDADDPATAEDELLFENELPSNHPVSIGFGLALVGPPLAAAVAYFMLFFRVQDRTSRYRVLLVSGGIILWFGFSAASSILRASSGASEPGFIGQLTSQLLGLLAALLVLVAYVPPRFLQTALGVRSVLDEERPGRTQARREARSLGHLPAA